MLAVKMGAIDCVKVLVEMDMAWQQCFARARVPLEDDTRLYREWEGSTPLHASGFRGDYQVTQYLLDAGFDPNVVNHEGQTPLHKFVMRGDDAVEGVRMLLRAGARPGVEDASGVTPLYAAVIKAAHVLVCVLLEHGADPLLVPWGCDPPLYMALRCEGVESTTALLAAGVYPNLRWYPWETPLHFVAETQSGKQAKALLHGGADAYAFNSRGDMPIHTAIRVGNLSVVKVLVSGGDAANAMTATGVAALALAVCCGKVDIVRTLLQAGAHPDGNLSTFSLRHVWRRNPTPLYHAADMANLELVEELLMFDANPDIVDASPCVRREGVDKGCTPLMAALFPRVGLGVARKVWLDVLYILAQCTTVMLPEALAAAKEVLLVEEFAEFSKVRLWAL
jgi:ankyrin repeat protein